MFCETGNQCASNVTLVEFMAAVRIRRIKFDKLVKLGSIKAIKISRKIYMPVEEVERYFSNASVQYAVTNNKQKASLGIERYQIPFHSLESFDRIATTRIYRWGYSIKL